MARSAIVVGGGIAGLSAAIALRKAGYDATVYEQAPKLAPVGAAISIWGNAMAGLDWLGCGDALRARAVHVRKLQLSDVAGRDLFGPVDVADADGWLPLRSVLQDVLLDALGPGHCRVGVRIDEVGEEGGQVIARAGGEVIATPDLAIVADGIHSATATALLGNPPRYRGYGAVLGIGPAGDMAEPGLAQEIWGERDRFGMLDAGDGRTYWFYMAPFDTPQDLAALSHDALTTRAGQWPSRVQRAVADTPPQGLIRIPIASRPMPLALGRGRVICIGDAAHAMEPNQGQGGCQGIEDAWLLGLLAQRLPPDAILPELEARRLGRVRSHWRDSALIGLSAHSPVRLQRFAGRSLLRMTPKWIGRRQISSRHRPPRYA